ncbi:MAG: hypothetical protein ABI144_03090, partial [Gallionella sp.]
VTYARAPYEAAVANVYDLGGTLTRSSFNVAAELGVLPGIATLGAAIRRSNSGVDDGTGSNATDNAIMLTVTYNLAQNMMASFTYTRNSGSYWDQINPDTNINPGGLTNTNLIGSRTTTINVFTLF